MKSFLLNRGVISAVLAVACIFALRPSFLAAALVPPQAAEQVSAVGPGDISPEVAAFFTKAGYQPEEARAILEQLTPAQLAMLTENKDLLASGGSGLLWGILLVGGIIALFLYITNQRVSVETSTR